VRAAAIATLLVLVGCASRGAPLSRDELVGDWTTPSGNAVRLAYDCPTTTRLAPKFWPDGLPAPTHTRGTTDCPGTVTVSGSGADIARDACLDYDSALKSDADTQEVPYLAEGNKGIRTCVWRWALPDERTR